MKELEAPCNVVVEGSMAGLWSYRVGQERDREERSLQSKGKDKSLRNDKDLKIVKFLPNEILTYESEEEGETKRKLFLLFGANRKVR